MNGIVNGKISDHLNLRQIASLADFASVITAASEAGILNLLESPVSILEIERQTNFDRHVIFLLFNVLEAGGVINRENEEFTLSDGVPCFPFATKKDVLSHLFQDGNSLKSDILKTLSVPTDGTKIPSPEPEWNQSRLERIALSAILGEIEAVARLASLTPGSNEKFLDLGAGHGLYGAAFLERYPFLDVYAADLESVLPIIKHMLTKYNYADRIKLLPIDFMKHNIEGLYDYILCANILHEDKKDCVLKKTYAALRQGGKIIVDVRVSDYPKTLSNSLNELSWYVKGKGKLKRTSTWFNFLSTYGFKQISLKGFYEIHAVITAVKE